MAPQARVSSISFTDRCWRCHIKFPKCYATPCRKDDNYSGHCTANVQAARRIQLNGSRGNSSNTAVHDYAYRKPSGLCVRCRKLFCITLRLIFVTLRRCRTENTYSPDKFFFFTTFRRSMLLCVC